MANTRRKFSAEFKREAVGQVEKPGNSVALVAKELELGDGVLRRWVSAGDVPDARCITRRFLCLAWQSA
jgi:transposase